MTDKREMDMRRLALVTAVLGLVIVACTAGDDSDQETSRGSAGETVAPALGVTDDTVKIGFTYIDLDALREAGGHCCVEPDRPR